MPRQATPENTPSSRGNGLARSKRRNFPIGRPKRHRQTHSRSVFSAPYINPLDGKTSWNRDLPMSVNSSAGNEDTRTSDKMRFQWSFMFSRRNEFTVRSVVAKVALKRKPERTNNSTVDCRSVPCSFILHKIEKDRLIWQLYIHDPLCNFCIFFFAYSISLFYLVRIFRVDKIKKCDGNKIL